MVNAALKYSRNCNGRGMAVMKFGTILDIEGQGGWSTGDARDIESCTKSLALLIARQLQADGLLPSLDVRVSLYVTEWLIATPQKATCTLRELLCFISGLNGGPLGSAPIYTDAIDAPMPIWAVGDFRYGPNPVHVAAEMFNRIVRKAGYSDWVDYLRQRVTDPAGINIETFDTLADGNAHLAGGAHMTILQMAKLGELMRITDMGDALTPGLFPAYRMNLWFKAAADLNTLISGSTVGAVDLPGEGFSAAGANGQRVYVNRAQGIVVARQGAPYAAWNDIVFLDHITAVYG